MTLSGTHCIASFHESFIREFLCAGARRACGRGESHTCVGSKFVCYASSLRSVVDTAVSWLCTSIVSLPNPPCLPLLLISPRTPSRSTPRFGFVRMRGVALAIRKSFIRKMLYFIQLAKVFTRESFWLYSIPQLKCS